MEFSNSVVLCIGDIMLDRYMYGEIERISPEAPVPVLRLTGTKEVLGGAGNVANNIAALGGNVILIGLVGADAAGKSIREIIKGNLAISSALVETDRRPTISKTRFLASRQQVVRADEESQRPLDSGEEEALISALEASLSKISAVVLSDYGKGALSDRIISTAIRLCKVGAIPVFVDPKSRDFARYRGATCITPNLAELALASDMPVRDTESVIAAARKVMAQAEAQTILVTRAEKGMILVDANGIVENVPAKAREVFDVSGAGDTVIATLALAHASGRTLARSVHIANAAAGVVVGKLGTATADISEVLHELDDGVGSTASLPGLRSVDQAGQLVALWKEQGLTVGFTNGCFDLIHGGHISLLAAARAQCDRLVVALNTDASVRGLKGPSRPINALEKRAHVMAAIRYVDCVVAFGEDTPLDLIRTLLPDVLIKGADYSVDNVVGAELVEANGGRVYLAPLSQGQSTTGVVERIRVVHA